MYVHIYVCGTYGKKDAYRILVGKREEKKHFEDFGVQDRIILKYSYKKYDGGSILDLFVS